MSYILDALKRSEQERHQDKMPSFSAENMILQTNQKKANWWPYALILVLILNALALFYFNRDVLDDHQLQSASKDLTRVEPKVTVLSASTSQRRAPPANVVKERHYIEPLKQAPSSNWQAAESNGRRTDDHLYGTTVDEGLLIKPKSKTKAPQKTMPITVKQSSEMNSFETPIQINPSYAPKENIYINHRPVEEVKSQVSVRSDNFIGVPLLTDLAHSFQKSIPELTFNSHIYSDEPSQRRVMINNFYLKEGQSFDGIQLIEIGEAFIKVSKDNTIFKLPVLRDWGGV